jgi:hypothetical protein
VGTRAGLDGCRKSRPPPGFDSRPVHPVASRLVHVVTTGIERVNQYNKTKPTEAELKSDADYD